MYVKSMVPVLVLLALVAGLGTAWATHCGDAYFNNEVTWWHNSPLYFTVAGAPANTCGDVWVSRNGGAYQETAGWICTNGSGSATNGPWYWSNQADDETAYAYVEWVTPSGTCYSPIATHVWDVAPPTASVTTCNTTTFSGTASDDAWGAGFNSNWAICEAEFKDTTTGKWWNPATQAYDSNGFTTVTCTCSGMPSMNITWSCPVPPHSSHITGNSYLWSGWVYDGGQWNNPQTDPTRCSFISIF